MRVALKLFSPSRLKIIISFIPLLVAMPGVEFPVQILPSMASFTFWVILQLQMSIKMEIEGGDILGCWLCEEQAWPLCFVPEQEWQ